jgi:hypothetical protein
MLRDDFADSFKELLVIGVRDFVVAFEKMFMDKGAISTN